MYGKIDVNVRIGRDELKYQIMVADIAAILILVTDFRRSFGTTLDLKNGVLKVDGEELLFHELQKDLYHPCCFNKRCCIISS